MWPLNCIVLISLYLVQNQSIFISVYIDLTRSNGIDFKINKFYYYYQFR